MAGKQRIEWLDALRGFAMVCVVLGHAASVPKDIELWIYAFHMPLFFMISGFLFRYERYGSFSGCARDQAKKLLVPYLLLYLINVPLWVINRKVFGDSSGTLQELLFGGLVANQDVEIQSNGALWFLPALFLTELMYWKLQDLHHRQKVNLAGSVGGCFLVGVLLTSFMRVHMPWHISCIPMTVVFYHIGHEFMSLYRAKKEELDGTSSAIVSMTIVCLLAIGTSVAFANGKISVHGNSYRDIALALIAIFALSLAFTLLFMKLPRMGLLDFIGRHSIVYLGFHVPILRFFENFPATSSFSHAHPLWIACVTIVILCPVSLAVMRFAPVLAGRWGTKAKAA